MLQYIVRSERKNNCPPLCRARVYNTCKDVWEFTRDLTTKFNNGCVWNSKFRRQTDGYDSSNYVFQLHIDLKAFNSPLIYSVHAAIERYTCGGKHCRHCSCAVGNYWVCSTDIKTNFLEVSWRETIIVSWNGLVRILLSSENHKRHRSEMRYWPDDSDTYNVIIQCMCYYLHCFIDIERLMIIIYSVTWKTSASITSRVYTNTIHNIIYYRINIHNV